MPLAELPEVAARVAPDLVQAYRTGRGVLQRLRHPRRSGRVQPSAFVNLLAAEWIPAIPDLSEKLTAPTRVVEFGCGEGWAASRFRVPIHVTVDGFDSDDTSIAAAARPAADRGVATASSSTCTTSPPGRPSNLTRLRLFEMVHDLADPVEEKRCDQLTSRPNGAVLVMDERAAESFSAPSDADGTIPLRSKCAALPARRHERTAIAGPAPSCGRQPSQLRG